MIGRYTILYVLLHKIVRFYSTWKPSSSPSSTFEIVTFQAAFECMYTLLDSCLDRLDIFEFLNHMEDGLKDHYDIKVSKLHEL